MTESQGVGADMAMTTVEGWSLAVIEDEPRVRDVDLAERLGFERPRKIRDIIKRHTNDGNLNDSDVRPTVARTRVGIAERNVTEYWLSEAAVLFIVTKSETPNAIAMTKEMIRVFMLARRGMLQLQQPNAAQLAKALDPIMQAVALANAVILERLTALEARTVAMQSDPGGTIGPYTAKEVKTRLSAIARNRFMSARATSVRSARRILDNELQARLGFGGTGCKWELFPVAKRHDLELALDAYERTEREVAKAVAMRAAFGVSAEQLKLGVIVDKDKKH